ncbi:helix-turn-helix transcriptional regulator [Pedobacter agri]|uniref:helix-turn-helix domain-containing protein n=1 Tax=Pedobacter agri TaxID=454586 RepID=UPI00292FDD6E|nr:helix-turn-helix transcriptional regulator [Pedobacter agri]
MSNIENLSLLSGLVSPEKMLKLEATAARHKQQANISFVIQAVEDHVVQVLAVQGEKASGTYASEATLIKRAQDLFGKFPSEIKIQVEAETHLPSPASLVDVAWIEKKMDEKGVRIKQIAFDTGIDRESIADWVNGKRSMSQIVKAMFYFYLMK